MRKNNRSDTAIAKGVVKENIDRMEKINLSEVIEIIRPLYTFVPSELVEKELKHKARYIMRSFKDENGVGIFFSDSKGVYINIEQSENIEDLAKVKVQLSVKYSGILTAMEKVRAKIKQIMPNIKLNKSI